MKTTIRPTIDENTFHTDVQYIESLWQRTPIGPLDMPIIDIGQGEPLVFVPILEHLEFVYARQIRALSSTHRVILYRRHETRTQPIGLTERAEELRQVLDNLGLQRVDLLGHGDAAMVLLEFATRYPERCKSLIIIAQAADYQIAPHPFIWLLHELFLRLPVEYILPAWFLRRIVIKYITARRVENQADGKSHPYNTRNKNTDRSIVGAGLAPALVDSSLALVDASSALVVDSPALVDAPAQGGDAPTLPCVPGIPQHLIEEQFRKIALWPFVYKFSVLPIIHYYDMRQRLAQLTMPILLINRADDLLSPEPKTRWLAEHLHNCVGYHIIPGTDRFFMYSQAETVNALIEKFLTTTHALSPS